MRYAIVIERAGHTYRAYCPDVSGCAVTGRTLEDAVSEIQIALDDHLNRLIEIGEPLPVLHDATKVNVREGLSPGVSIAYVEVDVLHYLTRGDMYVGRRG
jgi:predicted RNase H-like HicB family nuclease